jgi:hypothetical protein
MLGLLRIIGNGPQNIRRPTSFNKSRSHKLDVYVYIGRLEAVVLPYRLLDSVRYYSLESSPRILTNLLARSSRMALAFALEVLEVRYATKGSSKTCRLSKRAVNPSAVRSPNAIPTLKE